MRKFFHPCYKNCHVHEVFHYFDFTPSQHKKNLFLWKKNIIRQKKKLNYNTQEANFVLLSLWFWIFSLLLSLTPSSIIPFKFSFSFASERRKTFFRSQTEGKKNFCFFVLRIFFFFRCRLRLHKNKIR